MILPMFPLGTTLVPGQMLALRVFEPRYLAMVDACMTADRHFGVVLIERGSEVGGGDVRCRVGTAASIVDLTSVSGAEYVLRAVGISRLRVQKWLTEDPFPRAEVEMLVHQDCGTEGDARHGLVAAGVERVRGAALRLGLAPPDPGPLGGDPMTAGWTALAWAGVGPFDVQRILEEDDVLARIDAVIAALADRAELMELRLG